MRLTDGIPFVSDSSSTDFFAKWVDRNKKEGAFRRLSMRVREKDGYSRVLRRLFRIEVMPIIALFGKFRHDRKEMPFSVPFSLKRALLGILRGVQDTQSRQATCQSSPACLKDSHLPAFLLSTRFTVKRELERDEERSRFGENIQREPLRLH